MESLVITAGSKLSPSGKLHPVKTSIAPAKSLIKKLTPILALDKSLIGKQSAQLRSANSHLKCGICALSFEPSYSQCEYQVVIPKYWGITRLTFQPSTLNQFVSWSILTLAPLEIKAKGLHFKCDPQIEEGAFQFSPMVEIKQNQQHPFLDCGGCP